MQKMSGQWEVVGKKKDKLSNKQNPQLQKPAKETKKKLPNGVKVEEVLAVSQLKNLYAANNKSNKENQKPVEKVKAQENVAKKAAAVKKVEKPQELKPKPPKSIESALNSIKVEEFNGIYEKNKSLFPDLPIVWLKELAQFLNLRVPIDIQDPVFSNKPENYPLSVMPVPLKNIMEKVVKEADPTNAATFFDICLTAMANDMNKDLSALGHKFFLQYLALNNPKLVTANIAKHVTLRNSYQNRQSIGLSILWALGQGGFKDINVGLKVFQDIMYPVIEMKSYSRYVLKYLINLINNCNEASINKDQYLFILDVMFASKKNAPVDVSNELIKCIPKLNNLVFKKGADKYYMYIEPLLKQIVQHTNSSYRNFLCQALMLCIEHDQNCLGTWGKAYTKNLTASAVLLRYIENNWKEVSKKLNIKVFAELLKTYNVTNDELLLKKKKDDGLLDCVESMKKIMTKMEKSKKGSSFPTKFILFTLLAVFSSYIYLDVQSSGSWTNSTVCKALNKSGVYDYTNKALDRAKEGTVWVHSRIEQQFPGFTDATVEFTTPYIELGRDLGIIFCNVACNAKNGIAAKIPVVMETIDSYAPGLLDQIKEGAEKTKATIVVYYDKSREYLMTQVFVGKLAPEEIIKTLQSGVDAGMMKVTECYHWVHEKISTTIK